MIGQSVTKDGKPLDTKSLTQSKYNPPQEVKELFLRVQRDYETGYQLQRKPFDEFDGYSLLQRAKLDQETFAAFVGLQYQPKHKAWRWQGRKNTARNKLISILAHLIAGMLFPYVYAQNDQDEEDKMTARVMRILIEEKLRSAKYEVKFFFSVLSALVNPAVFVEVEYVMEMINIRQRAKDGSMTLRQVVDEAVSGLLLNIIPIDEIMLGDFYCGTGDVQAQPFIVRQRRISYDSARGKYQGRFFYQGTDLFNFVHAGRTNWMNNDQNQTLYDVEWSDADGNYVQEITIKYRKEDLELTFVGGVGMFDHENPYQPINHRRMTLVGKEWVTIPLYNIAMSGFEPIDPAGRFVWFKSGAFKEFWEDKKITELDRMLVDGVKLDVFKPMFLSGIASIDEAVIAPGAVVGMPQGATATPYQLGPNLAAAYEAIMQAKNDMSESTQDKIMQGVTEANVTATQTLEAKQNARIFLGVFGFMIAWLVKQIGELTMDCVIMHDTVGEVDEFTTGTLRANYKTILAKGKEKGRDVTNKVIFTDKYAGKQMSKAQKEEIEWGLYEKAGGEGSDQRIWEVNPYRFARTRYSMHIDAEQIVMKSMGTDRMEKQEAVERLLDPRIMPFVDVQAVANDFVIEEYAQGDPERYRIKQGQEELIEALLSQAGGTPPQK